MPLVTLLSPGQAGDNPMCVPLLERLKVPRPVGRPRTRPDELRADKAYSSKEVRDYLRARSIKTTIPEPENRITDRQRKGQRGGRPPKFDVDSYQGRNVVERRFCDFKQWRGLATRYDKHALVYRAGIQIAAVVAWLQKLRDTP